MGLKISMNLAKLSIVPFVALMVTGCSHQDFSSPSIAGSITDAIQAGRPYIKGDAEADAAAMQVRMAKVMAEWNKEQSGSKEYHVGPDDVLEITVLSLEEPGKLSKVLATIQADGTVRLPWVGAVEVGGVGLRAVEARIRAALEGRFIKDPQVAIAVAQFRSAPVVITGAVKRPGVYYLKSDSSSVLELLVEADGLAPDAGSDLLLIRNQGTNAAVISLAVSEEASNAPIQVVEAPLPDVPVEVATSAVAEQKPEADVAVKEGTGEPTVVVTPVPQSLEITNEQAAVFIDLKQLIDEGDLRLNLPVRRGDIINVRPKKREYFYVLGYVNRPGAYEIDKNKPLGALQAIAVAGGLNNSARAENTCLLRQTTNGLQVTSVDLTKIARGVRPPFDLQPGDTLLVGSSFMARMGEFVHPAVGLGMSAGAAYNPVVP